MAAVELADIDVLDYADDRGHNAAVEDKLANKAFGVVGVDARRPDAEATPHE